MIWLFSKGVMPWEMATMRIGSVDEFEKTIRVNPNLKGWSYNFGTKRESLDILERERKISFAGTPFEKRLRNGAIYSSLLFTKRFPFNHLDDLCGYSVEEIEEITGVDYLKEFERKVLTNREQFATIESTKANIKSQDREEPVKV